MADRGAEATVYSDLIEFEAYRRSVGMGLVYRGLEAEFQRARQVKLNSIQDNIVVDSPEDQEELEESPTYNTATMDTSVVARALIRGTSQHNILQVMEGPGPARLDQQLTARLAARMAVELDTKVFANLTSGMAYDNSDGNGFDANDLAGSSATAVGSPFSGTNAAGISRVSGLYMPKGTPPQSKMELLEEVVDSIGNAELQWRKNNIMAGELIGDFMPTGYVFCANPVLIRTLVKWATTHDILDIRSPAAEARKFSGILGTSAYSGTLHNVDLVATNAIGIAANAAKVAGYFVPISSALLGGVRPMMWDFGRFGQGNTEGRAIARTTVIWPYFAGRRAEGADILGRVQVEAG